jgi:hypothetical protein
MLLPINQAIFLHMKLCKTKFWPEQSLPVFVMGPSILIKQYSSNYRVSTLGGSDIQKHTERLIAINARLLTN